jgi:hypothetical protein
VKETAFAAALEAAEQCDRRSAPPRKRAPHLHGTLACRGDQLGQQRRKAIGPLLSHDRRQQHGGLALEGPRCGRAQVANWAGVAVRRGQRRWGHRASVKEK